MDPQYQIITWFSQEDFAFIAQIRQVPQCIAQGQTEEEALLNLKTLITNYSLDMNGPLDFIVS